MDYRIVLRSSLVRFIAGRAVLAVVSGLFIAAIVFFAIRAIPGDPVMVVLGNSPTQAQYDTMYELMGLDQPIYIQFATWLGSFLSGDLGHSFAQGKAVSSILWPALGNTLIVGGTAACLAILIGLLLGNASSSRLVGVRRIADTLESVFLSAPQYSVALVFLVAFSVVLRAFPASGLYSFSGGGPFDLAWHLVLPCLALALAPGAQMGRSLKTSVAALRSSEFLPSLRARGLSRPRVWLHTHHNALPPLLTVLGIQVGTMLGGSLFVERIFSIPGLGQMIVQAIGLRDYALVQAGAFVIGLIFVIVMLLTDIANALIDPRVRVGSTAR